MYLYFKGSTVTLFIIKIKRQFIVYNMQFELTLFIRLCLIFYISIYLILYVSSPTPRTQPGRFACTAHPTTQAEVRRTLRLGGTQTGFAWSLWGLFFVSHCFSKAGGCQFACLFVEVYFVQPFGKFVKKEMRRKCVRTRGWVRIGARRAQAQNVNNIGKARRLDGNFSVNIESI